MTFEQVDAIDKDEFGLDQKVKIGLVDKIVA
jgi:hypothetical protein